jgi:Protein of unknown function (DUF2796)
MRLKPIHYAAPALLGLILAGQALAAPAHVHGEARLEVTLDANTLDIYLISPLESLVGFEHSARNPKEQMAIRGMRDRLNQSDRQFILTPAAGCTATPPELSSPVFENRKADGHLDLEAKYQWQCLNPAALQSIDVQLFSDFKHMKRIKVQFIGPSGQRSGQITAKQPRFNF